ncbi:TPA: hypothetical protein MND73_000691 [Salmonella enterica subsp. houtenae]|nr:hypothetical protein [Salmonella enterica subsp. houtenae]
MAICISSPFLTPKLPDIGLSEMAGRFGAMTPGHPEDISNYDAALTGFMRATSAVNGTPDTSWPWGSVMTVSSEGCGPEGRRYLSLPLKNEEIVVQFFYSTSGVFASRVGFGRDGFTPWKKSRS